MLARWSKSRTPEPENRRDVDGSRRGGHIQALLDGVSAVEPNVLPGGSGFGFLHRAFNTVGHEVNSRIGSRPSVGDVVGQDEGGIAKA